MAVTIKSDALRNFEAFVQFRKGEKHPLRSATFSESKSKPFLKEALLHGCFSRF